MRVDQSGVDVEHDLLGCATALPGPCPGLASRLTDTFEVFLLHRSDRSPGGRRRSHLAEHRLVTQRGQVADAVAAISQHHHQVAKDVPAVVTGLPLAARCHCLRKCPGQAQTVAQIAERETADMVGDALAILGHHESLWTVAGTLATLHLRGALLERMLWRRTPQVSQFRRAFLLPLKQRRRAVLLFAVGTALSGGPPHRSQRAELPHWAPTLSGWRRNGLRGKDAGCVEWAAISRRIE